MVKAELFPTSIRAMGVGFPYAVTVALFGGTAEYIALYLKNIGHETAFYWYVTGCIFVSLAVYALMRDTRPQSAMDQPNEGRSHPRRGCEPSFLCLNLPISTTASFSSTFSFKGIFAAMTRASLNRTLRNAYIVLGLVLAISIAAKFADRIPAVSRNGARTGRGRPLRLPQRHGAGAHHGRRRLPRKRLPEALEVRRQPGGGVARHRAHQVGALRVLREHSPSSEDYLAAFCRISETIDNMRIVYPTPVRPTSLSGLYPYAPLA